MLTEFPQLRDDFQEVQDLAHLQMMEFALFTERACKDGTWATVEKCLQLADGLLRFGDSEINNAVYVSYLAWIIHDFASKKRKGALKD